MGLKQWDQPNDLFSYVDLAANFGLIDQHDHSSGKGIQIPNGGIANLAVDTTKITDGAITNAKLAALAVDTGKIADNAVTTSKIGGTIPNTKLASPMPGVYRSILVASAIFVGGSVFTSWIVGQDGTFLQAGIGTTKTPLHFPITLADHAVAGLTTQYRLTNYVTVNATAPGVDLRMSMNVASSGGGVSGQIIPNTGVAYSNTNTATAPLANTTTQITGTDFTIPLGRGFNFTLVPTSSPAAASMCAVTYVLQVHNV